MKPPRSVIDAAVADYYALTAKIEAAEADYREVLNSRDRLFRAFDVGDIEHRPCIDTDDILDKWQAELTRGRGEIEKLRLTLRECGVDVEVKPIIAPGTETRQ
jgi:hypothetical protein